MKKYIVVHASEIDSLDVSVSIIEAENQAQAEERARAYEDIENLDEDYLSRTALIVKEIPEGPLPGGSMFLGSWTNG